MDKYNNFILRKLKRKTLDYYMFDWDDNILVMPTMIHLEHKVNDEWVKMDVTTSEFTDIRHHIFDYYENKNEESVWRFNNNKRDDAFYEFRDQGPRGEKAFLEDTKTSIKYNKFGPVWDEFIDCLIGGHRFLIITARGHEPETLKNTVKWIIYNILTPSQRNEMVKNLKKWNKLFKTNHGGWDDDDYIKNYLDVCSFIGIYSDWFKIHFGGDGQVASPEKYKALAIKYFVRKISKFGKILNRKVSVGFSDDDLSTVKSIHKYFKNELSLDFPIEYNTWHTKDDGTKTKLD